MPPCPVCACPETTTFHNRDGRDLSICRDCRHIFWTRMPELAEVAAYYASVYTEEYGQAAVQAAHQEYYRGHARELAMLCGVPIERLALADVGCSYPVFVAEARDAGAAVAFGVDWSQEARADGLSREVAVLTPDEFEASVPDGFLDVLRYSHTLEHMIDPVGMLRRHVAKVRPGGLVYITQPNFPVLAYGPSPVEPHDSTWPQHLHFFNPLSFLRMTEAVGLTLERYFSVTDPEKGEARYAGLIDRAYAERMLAPLRERGEEVRGPLNNYPIYAGFDGAGHLRKPVPIAAPDTPPPGLFSRLSAALTGGSPAGGAGTPSPSARRATEDLRADLLAVVGMLNRRARGLDLPPAN